jgi:hypothetical protein
MVDVKIGGWAKPLTVPPFPVLEFRNILWWLKSRDLTCGITPLTTKPLPSKGEINSSLLDSGGQVTFKK